jgi:hypothetical protein
MPNIDEVKMVRKTAVGTPEENDKASVKTRQGGAKK